jgi:hemerythrin-like metal-binding protein
MLTSGGRSDFSPESMQLRWDKKYSVGIRRIDSQHKRIVDILNRLHWIQRESEEKELRSIFEQLRSYIDKHFRLEEELMRDHRYPGYEEQKAEHEAFIDRYCDFEKDNLKRKRLNTINIFNFVADWFTNHILKIDMKYRPFFSERGVR